MFIPECAEAKKTAEMLKSVDMISDNMHWASSGFCGKKQPMPVGLGGPEVRCKVNVGGR